MLDYNSVLYTVDSLGLTPNLMCCYGFSGTAGNIIQNQATGSGYQIYSGILSSVGNFHQISGSGYFSGQNISISNATGLNSLDWTQFLIYERVTGGQCVMFSNYAGSGVYSGYSIGISSNNKPYVEFYDNNGPNISMSENIWGTKNAMCISKVGGNLSLYYFNANIQQTETESYNVGSQYILPSANWYIGNSINSPSYFSGKSFAGYIDSYLYFNSPLLPFQVKSIFSGLMGNYTPSYYVSGNITIGGITYPISGLTAAQVSLNTGYIESFGMDSIVYTNNVNVSDISELYYYPQSINKTNINKTATFDRTVNMLSMDSPNYTISGVNLYVDSVGQLGSGYSIGGNIYNSNVTISGMFYITGQYISGSGYNNSDTAIYDIVTGIRYQTNTSGLSGIWSAMITGGTLISGYTGAGTGSVISAGDATLIHTIFYNYSGSNSGSNAFIGVDISRYSVLYPVDTHTFSGSGIFTKLKTFSMPVFEGVVGYVSNISGANISIYMDVYYPLFTYTGIVPSISNSLWFINGVKMKPNIDYLIQSGVFYMESKYLTQNVSGCIFSLPLDYTASFCSGNFFNTGVQRFARGQSQLFQNGMRQTINEDYIETSIFDTLSSSGQYNFNMSQIYLDSNDFLNV